MCILMRLSIAGKKIQTFIESVINNGCGTILLCSHFICFFNRAALENGAAAVLILLRILPNATRGINGIL